MAVFMLDTDSVSSVGSSISSLASQVDNVASSVSGYDTSCEDGFDFASAKAVIAENIKACATKIKNTSAIIDNVVSSHTSLQNSLVFTSSSEQNSKGSNASSNGSYSSSGGYSSSGYSSGGYSSGGYSSGYSSSYSSGGYSTGSYTSNGYDTTINPSNVDVGGTQYHSIYDSYTGTNSNYDALVDTFTPKYSSLVTAVGASIGNVVSEKLDTDKIGSGVRKFFEDNIVSYNSAGYALIGGMFVIACDSSIGKVGELVKFTLKDGSVINCIVGDNNVDAGTVKFYTNESWQEGNPDNISTNFMDNVESVSNYGMSSASTLASTVKLPSIGEHTSSWNTLGDDWTVVSTKVSVADFAKYISDNKLTQEADVSKYGGSCLSFSYANAANLFNGNVSDTLNDLGSYKYADKFNSFYSTDKKEILKVIYSEIVNGKPVVMQVNGNSDGSAVHFVTVVGFKSSVDDPTKLSEKDLLVIDSWDGKVERMDQSDSRFMTTGKQANKDYDGYYIRTLKG